MKKLLLVSLLLVGGCATPNIGATKEAALTPLNNISNSASDIPTHTGTIRAEVKNSTDKAIPAQVEPELIAIESDAKNIKSEASVANSAVKKQADAAQEFQDKYVAEKKLYDGAIIGGLTWKWIHWIEGLIAVLLIADAVAYFVTGVSLLNPLVLLGKAGKMLLQLLSWVMSLFRKPSNSVLGSGTIK